MYDILVYTTRSRVKCTDKENLSGNCFRNIAERKSDIC